MLYSRDQIPEQTWNDFVRSSPQGSVYHYTWYLDVVCPQWSAIIIADAHQWHAIMPLYTKQKYGITYSTQPYFAQYLGVLFRPQQNKIEKQWSDQKDWLTTLIETFPKNIKLFQYAFAPEFAYPFPFHWAGYTLSTQYSYWLNLNPTLENLHQNLNTNLRQSIKRSEETQLHITPTNSMSELLYFCKSQKQFMENHYYETVEALFKASQEVQHSVVLEVRDTQNELLTGCLLLKSHQSWINLFGGVTHPKHTTKRPVGAMLWKAIQLAKADKKTYFDFEGSMLEGVERLYRGFGAHPTPYLVISKNSLPKPLRWLKSV